MTLSESEIKHAIRLELPRFGVVLFNNASGVATSDEGQRIRYGLSRGSSDLIGFTPRCGVAVFTVIEVKTVSGLKSHVQALTRALYKIDRGAPISKTERRAYEQQMFVDLVLKNGGLAGFATSVADAKAIVFGVVE